MLKRVTFSGFRMFKNQQTIDFTATKSEILKEYNVKNKILNGGLFFGGNGSGKSSALNAISILLDLLFKDLPFPPNSICAFLMEKVASFKYEFVIENNNVEYSFSINENKEIFQEELKLNNENIFSRIKNSVSTIASKDSIQEASPSILFLRTLYFNTNFINYPILNKWMEFLKNSIYIDRTNNKMITFTNDVFLDTNLVSYIDKYGVSEINDFLSNYDIPYVIHYQKQNVLGNDYIAINVENKIVKCLFPIQLESYGNKLLIQLIPFLLSCKKNGGMLLIDEFGGGCHNKLNELLVDFLFKKCENVQSILVTHETNLLKTNLIRPDQVFIFDYNEEGSYVTKTSDASPRESQNLEKMYLAGVFGGIPLYDQYK